MNNSKSPAVSPPAPVRGKSGARKRDLRLPHESDETTTDVTPAPGPTMRRAHQDLAEGQTDTDCRNSAASVIKKAVVKSRREPNS